MWYYCVCLCLFNILTYMLLLMYEIFREPVKLLQSLVFKRKKALNLLRDLKKVWKLYLEALS